MAVTEDDAEELPQPREHVVRRTTKLEVGLALGLGMNLTAVVWFAATMASKVDQVTTRVAEAVAEIRNIREQSSDNAVLRYRIDQLERRLDGQSRR